MTDEISNGRPIHDAALPEVPEPTPGEWFALTGTLGLAVAGLAVGFLGLLGISAGNGFAQLFGFGGGQTLRDVVAAQAGTDAGIALIGLLLSVSASGRARRAGERLPGALASAGIVVAGIAVVVQVVLIVVAYVHQPSITAGLQFAPSG